MRYGVPRIIARTAWAPGTNNRTFQSSCTAINASTNATQRSTVPATMSPAGLDSYASTSHTGHGLDISSGHVEEDFFIAIEHSSTRELGGPPESGSRERAAE